MVDEQIRNQILLTECTGKADEASADWVSQLNIIVQELPPHDSHHTVLFTPTGPDLIAKS